MLPWLHDAVRMETAIDSGCCGNDTSVAMRTVSGEMAVGSKVTKSVASKEDEQERKGNR